ncbi:hypothetical protein [Campylobacter corcagiensis]|uniref:Uncharacterized protein n=1 Tax=Campylobacter corcagiensis TaxID=1448857 RepID=A0A7M1LDW2_9BACT|nr:hypothetical protein [Campylobacter corcagiensis]QKF65118.1 putative membrane protein [Campylobacter corcagiensis]QOQ86738.1 hypothetical protein IMC76_05815 [Campylobacter corcagiensis]
MGEFLFVFVVILVAFFLITWFWDLMRGFMYTQDSPNVSDEDKEQATGCVGYLVLAIIAVIIIAVKLIF